MLRKFHGKQKETIRGEEPFHIPNSHLHLMSVRVATRTSGSPRNCDANTQMFAAPNTSWDVKSFILPVREQRRQFQLHRSAPSSFQFSRFFHQSVHLLRQKDSNMTNQSETSKQPKNNKEADRILQNEEQTKGKPKYEDEIRERDEQDMQQQQRQENYTAPPKNKK
jgi:hypothetical protein